MKYIELVGSPKEIDKYLKEQSESPDVFKTSKKSFADYAKRIASERNASKREQYRDQFHWSTTKSTYVPIDGMDAHYVVNVLRKMIVQGDTDDLLESTQFRALIIRLSETF